MENMNDFFKTRVCIDSNGCWIWSKHKNHAGYGMTKYKGKVTRAHRLSYTLHVSEIPESMFVCHKCDVRDCVNPDHLFIGTNYDNFKDMVKKGRAKKRNGGSKNGIDFSIVNAIRDSSDSLTAKELAKIYKIHISTVYRIIKRQRRAFS